MEPYVFFHCHWNFILEWAWTNGQQYVLLQVHRCFSNTDYFTFIIPLFPTLIFKIYPHISLSTSVNSGPVLCCAMRIWRWRQYDDLPSMSTLLTSYGNLSQFSSVTYSHIWLFRTPWTAARHTCLYIISSFAQTHVHWASDAIRPFHPLSSPSPPAFNLSQHHSLFQWVSSLHQVARVLEFQP